MTAILRTLALVVLAAGACLQAGCSSVGCGTANPMVPAGSGVVALPNQDSLELGADDIVRVMRRAGFSDVQVLDYGTDLRNQLAATGAAQICCGGRVQAMFAADGPHLHVTSRARGTFIYDAETGVLR